MTSDYEKYRGKCKEFSEDTVQKDPTLRLVRGHYYCPNSNKDEPHWWCERSDGSIFDPTKLQFLSRGFGVYKEFDGQIECYQCGVTFNEDDIEFTAHGKYAFCSTKCKIICVGLRVD